MFTFRLNNSWMQQHGSDGTNPTHRPKRSLPLLQAVRVGRNTAPCEQPDGQAAVARSRDRRNLPDRRKAVRPMLPDRQNAGERRRRDRRRTDERA
jgi:hypothetical protein